MSQDLAVARDDIEATQRGVGESVISGAIASVRALRTAAAENPLGLAIGSIAVGFLVGLCLPVSDLERDRVGAAGERITGMAKSAAIDAIEQGKAAVKQAVGDAISGATESLT